MMPFYKKNNKQAFGRLIHNADRKFDDILGSLNFAFCFKKIVVPQSNALSSVEIEPEYKNFEFGGR